MKYLQIHTFYEQYLIQFYQDRPGLKDKSYREQLREILSDGFTSAHLFSSHLGDFGFDAQLVINNCPELQVAWCNEHGITELKTKDWQREIVKRQIEIIKPDVLYICNPIDFDANFIKTLDFTPRVIAGWRGQTIFDYNDFSCFDIILSSDPYSRERALQKGAKSTRYMLPSFPEWIAEKVENEPKIYDVSFCGQITNDHKKRADIIEHLAMIASQTNFCTPALFLHHANPAEFTYAHNYMKPSVWGLNMHKAIKQSKIALNVVIDFAKGESGNMRQFEITGTGSFLLTEYHPTLERHFKLGTEIETYKSNEELIEKIKFYLVHEKEREEIAKRGQQRCLKDHGMEVRAEEFSEILKEVLYRKGSEFQKSFVHKEIQSTKSDLSSASGISLQRAQYFEDMGLYDEAKYIYEVLTQSSESAETRRIAAEKILDFSVRSMEAENFEESLRLSSIATKADLAIIQANYIHALCLINANRLTEAKEALLRELQLNPESSDAKEMLTQVNNEISLESISTIDTLVIAGIHNSILLEKALDASQGSLSKQIHVIIDAEKSDGAPMSTFEKECNEVITRKNGWDRTFLYRGKLPEALSEYKSQIGEVKEVYVSLRGQSDAKSNFPNSIITVVE